MPATALPTPSPAAQEPFLDVNERRAVVTLDLSTLIEHARCPICMGIIKDTRAVSVCMHRFCKQCIEAWLRTQKDNNCPQCRAEFSSRRDCKPDPRFDQLLAAIFGDAATFDQRVLEPSEGELAAAKLRGSGLAAQSAMQKRLAPPAPTPVNPRITSAGSAADGTVHVTNVAAATASGGQKRPGTAQGESSVDAAQPPTKKARTGKRPVKGWGKSKPKTSASPAADGTPLSRSPSMEPPSPEGISPDALKRLGAAGTCSEYRGVRVYLGRWMAYGRASASGPQISLGLYDLPEQAARAYDLHSVRSEGARPNQRLNFPHLRPTYTALVRQGLAASGTAEEYEAAAQTLAAAAAEVPPPEDYQPPKLRQLEALLAKQAAAESEGGERAAQRAWELAERFPSSTALSTCYAKAAPAAHVVVEAAAGSAAAGVWAMRHLACPAGATMRQVKEAIAAGLQQQQRAAAAAGASPGGGAQEGTPRGSANSSPGSSSKGSPVLRKCAAAAAASAAVAADRIVLSVRNELDAGADFDSVCACSGSGGGLELRDRVSVAALAALMADGGEDLVLEYALQI